MREWGLRSQRGRDAVIDAFVFTERGRNDIEVFKYYYRLSPQKMTDLCILILPVFIYYY